jgi:sugar phosphate permease
MGEELLAPTATSIDRPTRVRYRVLAFLFALSLILYLDRVCISQAIEPIQRELDLSNTAIGFVLGAFTVAYCLFEVPCGRWGDRFGSRGVLTRIVLWWSVFTALTGAATGLGTLLAVRFLFGAGEAGALPNAARVVARWFPASSRGPAQGSITTANQLGGALAPVLTAYLIVAMGWRWVFVLFGALGAVWAMAFYTWFRDDPAEHPGVNKAERRYIDQGRLEGSMDFHPPVPWRRVLASANVWLLGAVMMCMSFASYLYMSWYPKYLQAARDVPAISAGWLSSLVLAGGALGCITGGVLSDVLIRWTGNRRWSRRIIGIGASTVAALALVGSIYCDVPAMAAVLTALACFSAQLQIASWWGVIADISGKHVGALFGLVNALGMPGAAASQLLLGFLADWRGSHGFVGRDQWDPSFYLYGLVLLAGALCWLWIDTTRSAVEDKPAAL